MRALPIFALLTLAGCGGAAAQVSALHNEPPDMDAGAQPYVVGLPTHKSAPPPSPYLSPVPSMNWTGVYVGAHVGASLTSSFTGLVGGRVGYDYQFGKMVFGVEGDVSYRPYSPSSTSTAIDTAGSTYNIVSTGKSPDISTLTARYGYVYDASTLMYVSAGLAGNLNAMGQSLTATSGANIGASGYSMSKNTRIGWTIGLGVDYALTPNWVLSGQYQFYDLPTSTLTTKATLAGATTLTSTLSFPESGSLATLGLNYHF